MKRLNDLSEFQKGMLSILLGRTGEAALSFLNGVVLAFCLASKSYISTIFLAILFLFNLLFIFRKDQIAYRRNNYDLEKTVI